jgi:O-antigen biosynthesis protein WbqP
MYPFVKRILDILLSGLALVVLFPVWIVAILGVFFSDPGPVFYLADRVGKDNKRFRMFKFRSMRVARDADEKSLRPDQSRIFPFGRFLRASKIDELPQLLNVFLGDMSVVGPRPAAADQVAITRGGDNAAVAGLKPGLTGPSALYDYLYGDSIQEESEYMDKVAPTRLALDRYYISRQSFAYDAKMVFQTILCIGGVLLRHPPVAVLRELVDAVDGDRRALADLSANQQGHVS